MNAEVCLLLGLLAVASNPSPFYAALGLVWGAGAGCVVLLKGGFSFLSLVLFLIYLGGMMVVFAYCAALVAEPYPEASESFIMYCIIVWVLSVLLILFFFNGFETGRGFLNACDVLPSEWWGVAELLCSGGWALIFCVWGLLLTLFVVLEVVRGFKVGALRAV